jgi:hypothetical protein
LPRRCQRSARNQPGLPPPQRTRQPRYVEVRDAPHGAFPLINKGISTSHVSALRPDLHGDLRRPGASVGQRHQESASPCKSGRNADTTHGELVSTTSSRLRRDYGDLRLGSAGPPIAPIVPTVARSARLSASARSLSVRCALPPPSQLGFSAQRAAAAMPKRGPCRRRFARTAGGFSTTRSTGERRLQRRAYDGLNW